MRHYEIIFLTHPDQTEQVPEMIERYRTTIENEGGVVHRLEDWGLRQLAYPIRKENKAHYVLMNIECSQQALEEVKNSFQFNDAIIRSMVIHCDKAITDVSVIARENTASGELAKAAQQEQMNHQGVAE